MEATDPGLRLGTDPVCGMTITTGAQDWQAQHAGRDFWFCGRGCREAFLANPGAYVS